MTTITQRRRTQEEQEKTTFGLGKWRRQYKHGGGGGATEQSEGNENVAVDLDNTATRLQSTHWFTTKTRRKIEGGGDAALQLARPSNLLQWRHKHALLRLVNGGWWNGNEED